MSKLNYLGYDWVKVDQREDGYVKYQVRGRPLITYEKFAEGGELFVSSEPLPADPFGPSCHNQEATHSTSEPDQTR